MSEQEWRNSHNVRGSDGPCDCEHCRRIDALEVDLATARGLVESGVAAIVNSRPLLTVEEGDWVKAALAYLESHSGGGGV